MSYFLAPAAKQFRSEVDRQFPNRDKSSDGWIGDASHRARPSDHNPCWTCTGRLRGIVMAVDIDIDDRDPKRDLRKEMIRELIGDPRVWYIISNDVIYSRTYNFRARRYTGPNGHWSHLHVSFRREKAFDTSPFWEAPKEAALRLDIENLHKAFSLVVIDKEKPKEVRSVKRYQALLNARTGANLVLDGMVGPKTIAAHRKAEKQVGGVRHGDVPDSVMLKKINQGMYRLVRSDGGAA